MSNGIDVKPFVPLEENDWNEAERYVFECARTGADANFNTRFSEQLDVAKEELWTEEEWKKRGIRPVFLTTILFCSDFKGRIFKDGVRIIGAWFKEKVDLSSLNIGFDLYFHKCRFDSGIDAFKFQTESSLLLSGSFVNRDLQMHGAKIGAYFFIRDKATFKGEVDIRGSKVGWQLDMNGSTFEQKVSLDGVETGADLFMSDEATFKREVVIRGSKVGGQLNMDGSSFKKKVHLEIVEISGPVYAGNIKLALDLQMLFCTFKSTLDISNTLFKQLDLTGTSITAELYLGSSKYGPTRWDNKDSVRDEGLPPPA